MLALKGTVALYSPKVLRAGMGAHGSLTLIENLSIDQLRPLANPLAVTSSHRGRYLHELQRDSYLLQNQEQTERLAKVKLTQALKSNIRVNPHPASSFPSAALVV